MLSSIRQSSSKYKYDITAKQIYTKDNSINISLVKQKLTEGSLIAPKQLANIIRQFQGILKTQPNVIKVSDPVIIVGDIHGQFFDLIKILALFSEQKINSSKLIDINGRKQLTTFIFLGDYVDRGIMAIQVMCILMLMKIAAPKNVVMLRGNHQSRIMAELYNFKQECNQKYGQNIYQMFMDAFDSLPISCIVNEKYFCVHGGITDKIKTISDIQKIERNLQIPLTGPYCDFIWSDPVNTPTGKLSNKGKSLFNDSRECSIYFGADLTEEFLKQNKLLTIIRGHEVFQQGYKSYSWLKKDVPQIITVFSAPNYCNSYGNKGAVMRIQNDKVKIRQYNQQLPQNYRLADKLQVFNWSLQKIISTINVFSTCLMNRICQLYIQQLSDEPHQKQLEAFLYYFAEKNKKQPSLMQSSLNLSETKKKFSIKQIQQQQIPKTPQQYRNHLFKRSQQYFRQSDRIPKVSKFKNSTMEQYKKQGSM